MIRNILFDFGGVIIDIDPPAVIHELVRIGVKDGLALHKSLLERNAYFALEKNELKPPAFRDLIRELTGMPLTDSAIDGAWNSIIGGIPGHRMELLKRLRKEYRIFLLSNSNAIHYDYYNVYVKREYGLESLDSLFDRTWYSFRLGLFKPDPEIFRRVLSEGNLKAEETLFIDDNAANVTAAEQLGLKGFHLRQGMDVTEVFENKFKQFS